MATVTQKPITKKEKKYSEILMAVFGVLFALFLLWIFFGGLLEKDNASNTIHIDCTSPGSENSRYCNGIFRDSTEEQNYRENILYR